jgi:hypothetical protein
MPDTFPNQPRRSPTIPRAAASNNTERMAKVSPGEIRVLIALKVGCTVKIRFSPVNLSTRAVRHKVIYQSPT